MRFHLLRNPLFKDRYIRHNKNMALYAQKLRDSNGGGEQSSHPSLLARFKREILRTFGTSWYRLRFLLGKVDIPQIEIVLTTKCTLRCESCANLMQYFSSEQQFATDFAHIKPDVDRLLAQVDSITLFSILGGEPLLFKELPQLINYLTKEPKIKAVELITNATIPFKDELLQCLQHPKVRVAMSDYSSNQALAKTLHQQEIIKSLQSYGVNYIVRDSAAVWKDIGKIYKRNRSQEDIRKNYLACKMPCVSLLCHDKDKPSQATISVCPIASALTKLHNIDEFEGDFVRVDSKNFREDIVRFYAQDYYKACDYCPNKWEQAKPIPPAIQTDQTLSLTP